MEESREVPHEEALAFARDQQFSHYIETSAKTGENVHEVFQTLTKHFYLLNEDNLDRFVSNQQYYYEIDLTSRVSDCNLYRRTKMKKPVNEAQASSG